MPEPVFTLADVTLPGAPERPRLDGVTLTIGPGVTALLGASGAGKSSLLEVLAGFVRPASGRVERHAPPGGDGEPGGLFWVPSDLGLWPGETVRGHLTAVRPVRDDATVTRTLAAFGLSELADTKPATLSAGERSRLAVARAAVSGAAVLLLDEPLAHVDPARLPDCWAALRDCWTSGPTRAVVFATHDPAAAVRESNHCVALASGWAAFAGPTGELYDDPPDERVGALLGPLTRLPGEPDRLVRAERIDLLPTAGGPWTVRSSAPAGPLTTTAVTDDAEALRTLHHRTGPPLTAGVRVAARLAFGLLVALSAGCESSGDGPALRFAEVRAKATPNAGAQLPAPRGVGIGPDDEAFVLDDAGRVLVFSADGEELRRWDMPANHNGNPEGICTFLAPGRDEPLIAVADTHYHRVVLFTLGGEEVGRFGEEGDGPGQFRYPVCVTGDDAGRLYVGEYGGNDRVQVFGPFPEFAPLRSVGGFGTGPGKFSRASGVAWVPASEGREETLLVADAFGDRIQVFAAGGHYRGVLGGEKAVSLHSPYDLARAADGTLWVPEYHGGRITALRPDGTLIGRWTRNPNADGPAADGLETPWGLDVDSRGRVWVADTGRRRLVTLVP